MRPGTTSAAPRSEGAGERACPARDPDARPRAILDSHRRRGVRLSIGEVFAEAWKLYTRFAGRLILIGAIVFGVMALVQIAVATSSNRYLALVTLVAFSIGIYWLQGALTVATADLRNYRADLTVAEVFSRVRPFLARLVLAGLAIAVVVGALVAVVLVLSSIPVAIVLGLASLLLTALWIGVIPAIVLEDRRVLDAFRRSHALVRGDLPRVVVIIVLSLLFSAIISTVLRALFSVLPSPASIVVGDLVANSVTVPFVALTWTLTFLDLRLNKDPTWTKTTI